MLADYARHAKHTCVSAPKCATWTQARRFFFSGLLGGPLPCYLLP